MSIRVLVADPDEYFWTAHSDFFEEQGVLVTHVADGLDCVDHLRRSDWDLLIIDPTIPWGGGDGVLALMDEDPNLTHVPAIVLTALGDQRVLYRMGRFRIADVQSKPLSRQRVLKSILAAHHCHALEMPLGGHRSLNRSDVRG